MKTIDLKERPELEEAVRELENGSAVLLRDGHAVAMVSPVDDDDLEWLALETSPEFIESIAHARQQAREGKVISHEQLMKELGID